MRGSKKTNESTTPVTSPPDAERSSTHEKPYDDILALQRSAGNQAAGRLLQHSGQPLDERTRAFMESRFGADFSQVRVHTDSDADALAGRFSAKAITNRNDVAFREGAYRPGTAGGDRLIAHELTHVIQQGEARGDVVEQSSGDSFEQEADQAAGNLYSNNAIQATPSSAAPMVQASLTDYFSTTYDDLKGAAVRKAVELLGPLDRSTMTNGLELALRNDIIWMFLQQHPALAGNEAQLEWLRSTRGAVGAFFNFITDPNSYKDDVRAFFDPYMKQGGQLVKDHGDDLLVELDVPAQYREALWDGMGLVGDLAYSAAEMVVFDMVLDTVFFWNFQSEHDIFDEAWKNYEAGKTDALDLIIEHISILINVVGRAADLIPLILSIVGTVGGGAGGGTVGSVAPGAGTAVGGGTGAGAGGAAGLGASEVVGLVASMGPAGLESVKLAKAISERLLKEQTDEQKQHDVHQIFASLAALAFMAVFAFVPGLAMRMGRAVGRQLKQIIPDISRLLSPQHLRQLGMGSEIPAAASAHAGGRASRPDPKPAGETSVPPPIAAAEPPADVATPSKPVSPEAIPSQSPAESPAQMHPRIAERRAAVEREKANLQHTATDEPDADLDNVVEFPQKPPPDDGPGHPEEAALQAQIDEPLLRTGTDDQPAGIPASTSKPDAPRAMADDGSHGAPRTSSASTLQNPLQPVSRAGNPGAAASSSRPGASNTSSGNQPSSTPQRFLRKAKLGRTRTSIISRARRYDVGPAGSEASWFGRVWKSRPGKIKEGSRAHRSLNDTFLRAQAELDMLAPARLEAERLRLIARARAANRLHEPEFQRLLRSRPQTLTRHDSIVARERWHDDLTLSLRGQGYNQALRARNEAKVSFRHTDTRSVMQDAGLQSEHLLPQSVIELDPVAIETHMSPSNSPTIMIDEDLHRAGMTYGLGAHVLTDYNNPIEMVDAVIANYRALLNTPRFSHLPRQQYEAGFRLLRQTYLDKFPEVFDLNRLDWTRF